MQILNPSKLTKCILQVIPLLFHISNSLPSASSHHQWCASRAWNHEEFPFSLSGEDAHGHDFYLFFLVSELGLVTPIGAGVGMDPDVGEVVDRNEACSLGHLGYGFRLHPVAPSLPTNLKSSSQSAISSSL